MSISFHKESIRFDLKQKIRTKQWINNWIIANHKTPGNISIIFTSNEHLKLMNMEYLNHKYFTDVITFDYAEDDIISGDIYISIDQVKSNADYYGVNSEDELRRVMIHGVLHLMGYNDSGVAEQEIMRKKENEALHLWMKPE